MFWHCRAREQWVWRGCGGSWGGWRWHGSAHQGLLRGFEGDLVWGRVGSGQRTWRGWCAAGWRGRGGRCGQWRLGRGQFAETILSVRVPRWRRGLVSEPQELRQISPAVPEGRAGGDRRGHAKGARRHGELKREGHGCQTPTWREGGGAGGRGSTQGFGPVPFTRTFLCQDCSNQFRDLRVQSVLDYPPPAAGTTSTSWVVHGTIHGNSWWC